VLLWTYHRVPFAWSGGRIRDFISLTNRDLDLIALDFGVDQPGEDQSGPNKVVELRYFAGLTIKENHPCPGTLPRDRRKELEIARAWLG
jgi:ECF sigma factor